VLQRFFSPDHITTKPRRGRLSNVDHTFCRSEYLSIPQRYLSTALLIVTGGSKSAIFGLIAQRVSTLSRCRSETSSMSSSLSFHFLYSVCSDDRTMSPPNLSQMGPRPFKAPMLFWGPNVRDKYYQTNKYCLTVAFWL